MWRDPLPPNKTESDLPGTDSTASLPDERGDTGDVWRGGGEG